MTPHEIAYPHGTAKHAHPAVFMVLIIPFGVIGGFLGVAIGYMLSQAGVPVDRSAALIALGILPHTWKFAWAPIADTTLSRKAWWWIAGTLTSIGIFLTGAIPPTAAGIALLSIVVLVSNIAVTFMGMAVESLMAYGAPDAEKGRAGGWFQAGNLGGYGVGGGLGLWLMQHLPAPWMAGAVLGVLCLLCGLALFALPEPPATHRVASMGQTLKNVGVDLWKVARSRMGALALVLCFLPIGSGAASNLWATIAKDWAASANTVATVTGVLGGIASALGCVLGGWICDRMNRKGAYMLYGVLQALCAVAMALAPRTESMYVIFTLAYAVITGLTYAGFSAFVLEAMGLGAAATKYSLFASLSNMPIWYMTNIDGWAHEKWNVGGMLYTEAALGLVGLVVFAIVLSLFPKRAAPDAAPAPLA